MGGPDGQTVCVTSGDGTFAAYDTRINGTKGLIAMSDFLEDEYLSLAIVKDGKKVVCGSQTGPLAIFSWGDFGDMKDRIKGHPMSVDCMAKVSEDGILTGCSDGIIRVVSVHSKKLGNGVIGVLGEHGDFPVECLAVSANGGLAASSSPHGQPAVQLWSTEPALKMLSGEEPTDPNAAAEAGGDDSEPDSDDSDAPKKKKKPPKKKQK